MKTVTFVYTDNVNYKATNVIDIEHDNFIVSYSRHVENESGTVFGVDVRNVSKEDLLYAVVKDHEDGSITIIPSIYDNFSVVPKGNAVTRQENIEKQNVELAERRAIQAVTRKEKETAKYNARREARKQQWLSEHSEDVVGEAGEQASSSEGKGIASIALDELRNAGLSENDIKTLKSINAMK